MLIKENFFQHQLCLFSPGDDHLQKMAQCIFYLDTEINKPSAKMQWWRKPNYLTLGRAVSGLIVDKTKLSPTLTLRVELKGRKLNSEICWFKLCSSKLMITSLTRSDLYVISKRTLSCSFPRTFGFQNGAVGDWADALWQAWKPKPSSDRELWFDNVHRLCELFQQLSLSLKTKKLLWSIKHSDCTHNASFTVEKACGVWQSSFICFLLNSRTLNE